MYYIYVRHGIIHVCIIHNIMVTSFKEYLFIVNVSESWLVNYIRLNRIIDRKVSKITTFQEKNIEHSINSKIRIIVCNVFILKKLSKEKSTWVSR